MLALPTRTRHGWRASPVSDACRAAPSANPRVRLLTGRCPMHDAVMRQR